MKKTDCLPGEFVIDSGSATADRTCATCTEGTFAPLLNAAVCTAWTECAAGSYVIAGGSATNDRQCAPCPAGQTTTMPNAPACKPVGIVKLTTGFYQTCALFPDGSIKCWGDNSVGQLGYGNTKNASDPSSVGPVSVTTTPGVTVTQLAMGFKATCAVLSDGSVKCWGLSHGLSGDKNGNNVGDDELPSSVEPVSITTTPGVRVIQLAMGLMHACALLSDGTVKCWGSNQSGELGYGNTETIGDDELPSSIGPVSITTTPGVRVTQLAAGGSHTCALLSDGNVKCWGSNHFGELGYGHKNNIGDDELPSSVGPVSITTMPGVSVKQLGAGSGFTCAWLSNGTIQCWGSGSTGQLGYGNTTNLGDDDLPSSVGPISITSTAGVSIAGLFVGGFQSCVLLSDGTVKCWGYNGEGELGYGNKNNVGDDELPSSVGPLSLTTAPGVTAIGLTGGGDHTCAVLSDGTIRCWGNNASGQLGYGNTQDVGDDEVPSAVGAVKLE